MNAKILNRDFLHPTDGWYQIEPKGAHPNRAAKVIQVIDAEAITAIVNRFNADAAAGTLRHGSEMLIDHEHFAADTDKESRAYGWLQELQNREDGIYGRIRWTTTGKAAVDGGDYRFFSTEYDPADLKVLNSDAKARQVRPLRLDGLSLTNMNNNRGQKPITNRGEETNLAGARASAVNQNKGQNTMKNIATKLGLAAEASEDAILAEVTKIMNRATEAEGKVTPLTQRVTALETDNQTLLGEQVDALLAGHGVKEEKVINRLKPVLVGLKNRDERIAALTDFGFKPLEAGKTASTRVLNRGEGKAPEATVDSTDEQAKAEKIRNRANQLVAGGMKFEQAWNMARTEK